MPRLDLDLSAFAAAREEIATLTARQRVADLEIGAANVALAAATRRGASPNVTQPLVEQVAAAEAARRALVEARRAADARFDALADAVVRPHDPASLVESLDGRQPIAFMPVRIETRYVAAGQGKSLRIRIYPDDINTLDHTPAPTAEEMRAAKAWWTARFAHDDDEAARILRDLTAAVGRGRAAWVMQILTPLDPVPPLPENGAEAEPPAGPRFPNLDAIDALAKTTRAVLLPERFCAIGYDGARREVFRVWGGTVPDELVLSPDWLDRDRPEALLGGDRAWMADFDAAVAKGLAIEVTQADVAPSFIRVERPFNLATGTLARLFVVGFDWTRTAADGAIDFGDLCAAQRDSTGLGFAAAGTPTNNTEAAPSGYSTSEERTVADATAGTDPLAQDAIQLFTWAFGIAPEALPADHIVNAHLCEQRNALHMINALWRATMGDYLKEMWNPDPYPKNPSGKLDATLYAVRRYAASYVRPTGALPVVRVGKQPYGILPLTGKRFVDDGNSGTESAIGRVVGVLRPIWELASAKVPLLVDGDVKRAQDILQTVPWSQTAKYREKETFCRTGLAGEAQRAARMPLVNSLFAAVGIRDTANAHIVNCSDFKPEPPYAPVDLIGVPWVLADAKNPTREASDATSLPATADNYLSRIATAAMQTPAFAETVLDAMQGGPSLLQALVAYSVKKEQGDSVEGFVSASGAVHRLLSTGKTTMPYVEALPDNEALFTVQTPRELSMVSIPAVTGRATLGEHVAATLVSEPVALERGSAWTAAVDAFKTVDRVTPETRNLSLVRLSIDYLSKRTVGELNVAFRSTLDLFSYRLDAWITARANRRLEAMRATAPLGLYLGAYAWVENLAADDRPDSEGWLLAPSQAQAATAAILRSGFMANHEQGAFDIALDSKRTSRAVGILQGLTRDQPLAALYGYRIERGLRDAQLGKFIWPLRRAYPYRPAKTDSKDESDEAIGARDVIDGVALLADLPNVFAKLTASLGDIGAPKPLPGDDALLQPILQDAVDLADSVSDLLMAEGMHQIVQGNLSRASAAMAVADKQALPIETQVGKTPRSGASYTQRIVAVCPAPVEGWPADRRARVEPGINAWLATMLGDPTRFRFSARVHRKGADGHEVIDADAVIVTWDDLGLSPLSAIQLAAGIAAPRLAGGGETGFRGRVASALIAKVPDPATAVGLDIDASSDDRAFLGLVEFEAFATTLKTLVDKARFATRKDLVRIDDQLEATLPKMGEYPGVDVAEIVGRADGLVAEFDIASAAVLASVGADALNAALADLGDFLPQVAWPAQVFAIDAAGADPAKRDERATEAVVALKVVLDAKHDAAHADPPLLDGQLAASDAQIAQHAIERIKLLMGKDFPVLPRFALGPYVDEFNASLADQEALSMSDPWRIPGWLTQVARVREGADRFAAAVAAHEALASPLERGDLKLVQFPHRARQVWAALPEAWVEEEGTPFDPDQVPEELQSFLAAKPGTPYRAIQRAAPDVTIALHAPALDALAADATIAAFVCDEWPEFVPDPFQTAAIGFHYDAPGARPPQTILLALPPTLGQEAWHFDDAIDVIHEALDLAKVRGVRPAELSSGLGTLLPASYLPHAYTADVPGVRMLEMVSLAASHFAKADGVARTIVPLGKG